MKKLVLFLAVAFSVSLFSCGGSDKKAEAADSAEVVAVEEVAVVEVDSAACCADSACVDSCAAAETTCEAAAE